jgi:hypothetical protein
MSAPANFNESIGVKLPPAERSEQYCCRAASPSFRIHPAKNTAEENRCIVVYIKSTENGECAAIRGEFPDQYSLSAIVSFV